MRSTPRAIPGRLGPSPCPRSRAAADVRPIAFAAANPSASAAPRRGPGAENGRDTAPAPAPAARIATRPARAQERTPERPRAVSSSAMWPHSGGTQYHPDNATRSHRSALAAPAHAGMDRHAASCVASHARSSRACGNGPACRQQSTPVLLQLPRMREWTAARPRGPTTGGAAPAHAGMGLARPVPKLPARGSSRACGNGPARMLLREWTARCPPGFRHVWTAPRMREWGAIALGEVGQRAATPACAQWAEVNVPQPHSGRPAAPVASSPRALSTLHVQGTSHEGRRCHTRGTSPVRGTSRVDGRAGAG